MKEVVKLERMEILLLHETYDFSPDYYMMLPGVIPVMECSALTLWAQTVGVNTNSRSMLLLWALAWTSKGSLMRGYLRGSVQNSQHSRQLWRRLQALVGHI